MREFAHSNGILSEKANLDLVNYVRLEINSELPEEEYTRSKLQSMVAALRSFVDEREPKKEGVAFESKAGKENSEHEFDIDGIKGIYSNPHAIIKSHSHNAIQSAQNLILETVKGEIANFSQELSRRKENNIPDSVIVPETPEQMAENLRKQQFDLRAGKERCCCRVSYCHSRSYNRSGSLSAL